MGGGREDQARARGESIRAELLTQLKAGGSQEAAGLLPQIETPAVSVSEVAFQLDRLADEGEVVGRQGECYRLARGIA